MASHLPPPPLLFDPAALNQAATLPSVYQWPENLLSPPLHSRFAQDDEVPTIDLAGFRAGDEPGTQIAVDQIRRACADLGFFQLVNHGVDMELVRRAHAEALRIFRLPLEQKMRGARVPGEIFGFMSSFIGRFTANLPWKESLSLQVTPSCNVRDYVSRIYGEEENQACSTLEDYGKEMQKLSLDLMELLALSLNLPRECLKSYFKANVSFLRANYFPPSKHKSETLGIGPHKDPVTLTILHQDNIPGLQVRKEDGWVTVKPKFNAFVVNLGDLFQVLCNDHYKSVEHRVINDLHERKSFAYFFSPDFEALVAPLLELVDSEHPSRYKEFSWAKYFEFTQKNYRSDTNTLLAFQDHLILTSPTN